MVVDLQSQDRMVNQVQGRHLSGRSRLLSSLARGFPLLQSWPHQERQRLYLYISSSLLPKLHQSQIQELW